MNREVAGESRLLICDECGEKEAVMVNLLGPYRICRACVQKALSMFVPPAPTPLKEKES